MTSNSVVMARAAARAAARSGLAVLRARRARPHDLGVRRTSTSDGQAVTLQPAARRRSAAPHGVDVTVVSCAGKRVGELWTRADLGTSTHEILARLDVDADADQIVLSAALRFVLDDVAAASPDVRVAVRRSLDPLVRGPGAGVLSDLGFTQVATFPGDAASPQAWAGEERWELLP